VAANPMKAVRIAQLVPPLVAIRTGTPDNPCWPAIWLPKVSFATICIAARLEKSAPTFNFQWPDDAALSGAAGHPETGTGREFSHICPCRPPRRRVAGQQPAADLGRPHPGRQIIVDDVSRA
jgi:hypothetical protein